MPETGTRIYEKIATGEIAKQDGNQFFKTGQFQKAIRRYHYCLMYLKDIEKPSVLANLTGCDDVKITDDEKKHIASVRSACYNNLASCLLKKNNFEKVIEYTTKVLSVDPNNTKALFRRGQAYLNMRDVDKAEKDFNTIQDIDAHETCAKRFYPLIEKERKRQLCDERKLYKTMMKTNGS